jgi:hypothetical protein
MRTRRNVNRLLGSGAVIWPVMVQAQQPDQIRRVGVLTGDGENDPDEGKAIALRDECAVRLIARAFAPCFFQRQPIVMRKKSEHDRPAYEKIARTW